CGELRIKREQVPLKPLLKGKFPQKEEIPMAQEVKQLSREAPGARGGKIGGKVAANRAASAATIAKVLAGIEFPKGKHEILNYAEKNKQRLSDIKEVLDIIKQIPDKSYHNMVEVEKALGAIR
ncbi:MAG: DUF2795 domain-containing protein, partial [Nitrososphaeraceae archaeon]